MTTATVELRLHLDLPIPRLLAGAARRVIEHEADRAVAGFLDRLATALG